MSAPAPTQAHTPPPALQAPVDRSSRPQVVGEPSGPQPPFPIYLAGTVQRGFGRGGKDLGCPTANLPASVLQPGSGDGSSASDATKEGSSGSSLADAPTGVYYGYARVLSEEEGGRGEEYQDKEKPQLKTEAGADGAATQAKASSTQASPSPTLRPDDSVVHPMVMSLGWNPFFANKTKTAEVHIMHPFKADFYGLHIRVVVLGYIRPEYNYVNVDALIQDIDTDKQVALRSLDREPYRRFGQDDFFATGTIPSRAA